MNPVMHTIVEDWYKDQEFPIDVQIQVEKQKAKA
jgi:hypothetical protein